MNTSLYNTLKSEKEASINTAYVRIKKYEDTYNSIYTPKLARMVSDSAYIVMKYVALIVAFLTLIFAFFNLSLTLSDDAINKLSIEQSLSYDSMVQHMVVLFWRLVILSLIIFLISFLFHRIGRQNKVISRLAIQMLDVINTEKKHLETEKQSYFNLLDTIQRDMNKPEVR